MLNTEFVSGITVRSRKVHSEAEKALSKCVKEICNNLSWLTKPLSSKQKFCWGIVGGVCASIFTDLQTVLDYNNIIESLRDIFIRTRQENSHFMAEACDCDNDIKK